MTTREQKIKAIYEKIANKQPNIAQHYLNELNANWTIEYNDYSELFDLLEDKVMIWDVLEWIYLNIEDKIVWNLLAIWNDWRKPIEEQSDECIDYIYNLLWLWDQ